MGRKRKFEGDSPPSTSKKSSRTKKRGKQEPQDGSADADSGEIHPLLNTVVLAELFNKLPLDLLATSRLVCRTWRDVALPIWRSKATLKLDCVGSSSNKLSLNGRHTSLSRFLQLFEADLRNGTKPFQKFHLERWRCGSDARTARFWDVVGTHMTSLKLFKCTSNTPQDLLRIVNQFCPNLETLMLEHTHLNLAGVVPFDPADYNPEDSPDGEHPKLKSLQLRLCPRRVLQLSYSELMLNFPNMASLKLTTSTASLSTELLSLLRVVQWIRGYSPQKLPLQHFTACSEALDCADRPFEIDQSVESKAVLELLRELRIPLQGLSVRLGRRGIIPEYDIKEVLEFHGGSLITFRTVVCLFSPRYGFPFELELRNLQEVNIGEGFCDSFQFIRYTPNLRKLVIHDDAPLATRGRMSLLVNNAPKSEMEDVSLVKLTDLNIGCPVMPGDIQWLVKWMPKVKKLEMFLNDEQFRTVCGGWKDLVKLKVLGMRLTDAGVTGMSCTRSTRRGGSAPMAVASVEIPNITFLQELKVFDGPQVHVTDTSILYGFSKMRQLRRATILRSLALLGSKAKAALLEKNIELFQAPL